VSVDPTQPAPQPRRPEPRRHLALTVAIGALLGIATALIALGIAQLVAAVFNSQVGGPVDAVGELSIDHAPAAVKSFAINTFGSNDKTALVWGIRGVLIIFAVVIGILALRKLWLGMVGLAVFIAIGIAAAESQPNSRASDVLPALIGGLVGALFMRSAARRAQHGFALGPGQGGGDQRVQRPADAPYKGPVGQNAQPDRPAQSARPAYADDASPDRRKFLLLSGATAAGGLLVYGGGSWLGNTRNVTDAQHTLRLPAPTSMAPPLPPGSDLKVPGLPPFITPNDSFYRVDTAIVLPEILPANWHLRIHGMVQREITLTFDQLIKRPLIEDYITLCCVSNPVGGPYISNAKWLGASLRSLLRQAGIKAGADQLFCRSSDGFTSGTPVATAMDGRDALLAVAMNDAALPVEHGFPARLVIPGLYGYVSACKWIVDIEVTTYAANQAYWVQRGWAAQAPVKTESRIDVPASGATIKSGTRTAIAGEAWAQHKGIDAVEVRVNHGPWQQAQLGAVPNIDTWRQWVYYWDANVPAGSYMIEARATDKTGYTQTALATSEVPNGASGYPSTQVTVSA